MTKNIELNAQPRSEFGKGASRRLRREQDLVPANLYGADKKPQAVTFMHKDLIKALENEAFHSSILTIKLGGQKEKAVLKDLQRHPSRPRVLHLDLQRVKSNEPITMTVPFHFIGEEEAPGVKVGGGSMSHNMSEIEIKCLPDDLPAAIEIDVSKLELDEIIHISAIQLPKGVELTMDLSDAAHDHPVVSVHTRPEIIEAVEEAAAEEAAPEGAEEAAVAEGKEAKGEKAEKGEASSEGEKKEKS